VPAQPYDDNVDARLDILPESPLAHVLFVIEWPPMAPPDLRPEEIVDWTDPQIDDAFRRAETLPLDQFVNAGEHQIDVEHHEICNDANFEAMSRRAAAPRYFREARIRLCQAVLKQKK
jgi:hypothetical protein